MVTKTVKHKDLMGVFNTQPRGDCTAKAKAHFSCHYKADCRKKCNFALPQTINGGGNCDMEVVYDDNHLIIVNKQAGELVQGDRTGDPTLIDSVKAWIKEKYNKPGNVFLGVTHRIDRPTCGLVVMAKTSKGLSRMNELFRKGEVHKTYWAVVGNQPPKDADTLTHYLKSVESNNKTHVSKVPREGHQKAVLNYRIIAASQRYWLLEVELITGRKHQIRAQLSAIGCPIKGDLKYGAPRSNPDGGISLQAHRIRFIHPVSGAEIDITAPLPDDFRRLGFDI